jgi:hypothetical protein
LFGVQHFEPIAKLDVGGVRVTISLTLRRFPDTMGSMLSGSRTIVRSIYVCMYICVSVMRWGMSVCLLAGLCIITSLTLL